MGFFSWKTQDTDESIPSSHSERPPVRVTMMDDKGNVWEENEYEGYGLFGGKDFYELLAEMNGFKSDKTGEKYTDEARDFGIGMAFENNSSGDHTANVKYPNLVKRSNGWKYNPSGPESCEYQGFFYNDEKEDNDF